MICYEFFAIITIICVKYVCSDLPSYVHLHTTEEIMETEYVMLDKLDVCKDSQNIGNGLLVAIKSASVNRKQREIIRQTWLPFVIEYQIPYIFVLGSTTDEKLFIELLMEDKVHNDLLIGKPVDNYYNLTLKGMFTLSWARSYCPGRWLLYVDDDTIVNVQKVIDFVTLQKTVSEHALYCNICRLPVIRNPNWKFFVPESIWKYTYFPDYCHGYGYLIPPYILSLLHETSRNRSIQPKLWLEDVFITGIVAKALSIQRTEAPFRYENINDAGVYRENLVLGHMGKEEELRKNWEKLKGNCTLSKNAYSKSMVSHNQRSTFQRNGHLIKQVEMNNKPFKSIIENCYSVLSNYSFSLKIALVIMLIVLIRKKLQQYMRQMFSGNKINIY